MGAGEKPESQKARTGAAVVVVVVGGVVRGCGRGVLWEGRIRG